MAIDDREKRQSISAIPVLIPGVTPNAGKDQQWRQESARSYSGIAATVTTGGGMPIISSAGIHSAIFHGMVISG